MTITIASAGAELRALIQEHLPEEQHTVSSFVRVAQEMTLPKGLGLLADLAANLEIFHGDHLPDLARALEAYRRRTSAEADRIDAEIDLWRMRWWLASTDAGRAAAAEVLRKLRAAPPTEGGAA